MEILPQIELSHNCNLYAFSPFLSQRTFSLFIYESRRMLDGNRGESGWRNMHLSVPVKGGDGSEGEA